MGYHLLIFAGLSVLLLIFLIARWKVHAFIALIVASLFMGLLSGMPLQDIAKGFQEGVGAVLSSVAIVVGLGTIIGKLLAESGGAEVIASTLIRIFGAARLPWAMLFIAFFVGLPVFFTVGLPLLAPILYALTLQHKMPFLRLGLPMLAGLSVAHGLVPPHPGPMAALEALHADPGKTVGFSLLVGIPVAVLAGPILGNYLSARNHVEPGALAVQLSKRESPANLPGFGLSLFTICLPVLLMLLGSFADLALPKSSVLKPWFNFIASPAVALLFATLFAFWSFGIHRGASKQVLLKWCEDCLGPVAAILLVVGAGGGFNKILTLSGVATVISSMAQQIHLSPLVLGFVIACLIRIATGSATVAIQTAAGMVSQLVQNTPSTHPELVVVAMGAGSLILSHVNDGGFWFVKEYMNMTVQQTLRTWTIIETVIALTGFIFALALDIIL